MTLNKFNLYGYDPDTYNDCRELVKTTNHRHLEIINLWFIIVNIVFVFFALNDMFGVSSSRTPFYLAYTLVSVIFELFLILRRELSRKYANILIYVNMALLLFYSVVTSITQPYMAATMFVVFLVLVALSYIDNMLRISLVLIASSVLFIWQSFENKPASIAYQDTYNTVIFFSLAIILHYSFQRARVSQFVTYQKNIQIQQELEVKSSFDALTSLLNRGRFFSMAGDVLKTREKDEFIAICMLDLDNFKQINDKLGHQMGDKAIQIAGSTVSDTLGIDLSQKWLFQEKTLAEKTSFAGRLGGDEFIALVRGRHSVEEITQLLESMRAHLNGVEMGELHGISASFGVTILTDADHDIDDAYRRADEVLYTSKREGKNRISFYEGGR